MPLQQKVQELIATKKITLGNTTRNGGETVFDLPSPGIKAKTYRINLEVSSNIANHPAYSSTAI